MTDGAAAVLMMTRREALARGMPVLGIFRSFSAVGVDPAIMGVGPAVAIPDAVAKVSRWLVHCNAPSGSSRDWDLSQVTADGIQVTADGMKLGGEGVCTTQARPHRQGRCGQWHVEQSQNGG